MKINNLPLKLVLFVLLFASCTPQNKQPTANWCDKILRPQFAQLEEVVNSSDWFRTFRVGENVFAIAEPYNYQEVISYLILGNQKALLFDTGMGMGSIASVVRELTTLPVLVLNSHTHYDHIGGNYEFDNILAMNTQYTIDRSKNGIDHKIVQHEVTKEAFCPEKLPELDTTNYYIKPFQINQTISDGEVIDLGGRSLEVISAPGHTPDAIALFDRQSGYLFTGDTFYEGPIWLFDPETDLTSYQTSIERLLKKSVGLKKIFPAHNIPTAPPERLEELVTAFRQVVNGEKPPLSDEGTAHIDDAAVRFEFEHFSFLIRGELLSATGTLK